jgi:raffinose/stachyose/melibiose transport system substrate-binding protein
MVKKAALASLICMFLISIVLTGCSKEGASNNSNTNANQNASKGESTETAAPAPAKEAPPEEVKLKFFTGKVETVELIDEMILAFEKENPHIDVEQEYQKDASNVIKVKFASGDIPDITTVVTQDYIDQGKYLDLSNEAFWDRILPSIKDLNTDMKTGKQFSVASNVTMAGIFYNKDIFAELGLEEALTWDEFKANLQAIKDAKPDVVPMFLPGKEGWSMGHLIEFLAHGMIKQEYGISESRKAFINNDQEKLAFDAAGGSMETFAQRLLELKNAGLINEDALTATYDNQKEAIATGKAAVISQGMWVMGDLLTINPETADFVGFSPFPAIKDGTKPVVLSAEDSKYAITADSEHPEEAKKFLEFLFKPENVKAYSEAIKNPPAFTDVDADWGPLKDETKKALETGVNIQFTEAPAGFSGDDAGRMVQEILVDKYESPSAFASAYKEVWDNAWNATH